MTDLLRRIKRAVLAGRYAFSEKARLEMEADGIVELDVAESILNAVAIYKKIRSRSPFRRRARIPVRHSKHESGWLDDLLERQACDGSRGGNLLFSHLLKEGNLSKENY
ncbi:MAG: hypothetical protein GXP25_04015 [Planctomycetes bacterium]|nr:hypothetical protein [Planctomycetota bacterium]